MAQYFALDPLRTQVSVKTMDLSQAAGTYDLAAVNANGGVIVESIEFYVTETGATFTDVAAQTDDTTPEEFLSAAEGAVANITAGKVLKKFAGDTYIHTSKKIQYTITGSTGDGTVIAIIKWRPSVANAGLN